MAPDELQVALGRAEHQGYQIGQADRTIGEQGQRIGELLEQRRHLADDLRLAKTLLVEAHRDIGVLADILGSVRAQLKDEPEYAPRDTPAETLAKVLTRLKKEDARARRQRNAQPSGTRRLGEKGRRQPANGVVRAAAEGVSVAGDRRRQG